MSIKSKHLLVSSILLLHSLAACQRDAEVSSSSQDSGSASIAVDVTGDSLTAPDTIASGWLRLRVTEDDPSHIVVLFRMPAGATAADVERFVVDLDSAPNTPAPFVALGGPEIGATGEVHIEVTPGQYVLACVARAEDGHRHARNGEVRTVVAVASRADSARTAPSASINVDMVDFAYTGNERWPSGSQVLHVRNNGAQDHQLRLARLNDGVTLRQVMDAENPMALMRDIAGVARMSASQHAYLPVDLAPGTYLLSCLVTDPNTRRPHVDLGMLRVVTVE
jgi:hypothetical protein